MIWLASYPRSGNTFFRNILYELYDLESSTFHLDANYHLDNDYTKYPFVKTHLLPNQLKPKDASIPAVYIVRDGRDALVSMAHHRRDIIEPGTDFCENLKAAVIAEKGTFFGGWSKNVAAWMERAELIIRYEDLLLDPIKEAERIRSLIDLPEPNESKLPKFEKLKFGIPQYGSGKDRGYSLDKMKDLAEKNFRKGKAGSWKEEMPEELHDLFWSYHGDTMERLGYSQGGEIKPLHPDLDYQLIQKLGESKPVSKRETRKILIESNKVVSADNDGVKRYQMELLKGFLPLVENVDSGWQVDLFIHGKILPLLRMKESVLENFKKDEESKNKENQHGNKQSRIERADQKLVKSVPSGLINFLHKHNIKIFHLTYEFLKRILITVVKFTYRLIGFWKNLLYQAYIQLKQMESKSKLDGQLNQYDLIHLPLTHHYLPFRKVNTNLLATVHDLTHLSFPQFHTKINISNSKNGLDFIANRGADVIAVSNSTKNDMLQAYKMDPAKVHMVYEAADRQKFNFKINRDDIKRVKAKYGIDKINNYFLCLSTIEPRKNLENTIRGFNLLKKENPELPLSLVIAGKKGWDTTNTSLWEIADKDWIYFTGFIDDEDISAIYSDALAMCYLSFYEGFGLPPLEAMCCGTPVIYGNNSSLTEVVGTGGIACDPYDVQNIKEKIEQIFFNTDLRDQKRKEALKQSLRFSWRYTVRETLDVYKEITDKRKNI